MSTKNDTADFDIFGIDAAEIFYEQAGVEPVLPVIQYITGAPDKKSTASGNNFAFTGCFFVATDRYAEKLPGFEPHTLFTQSGEEIEGQAAHKLPDLILLGSRACWMAAARSPLPVRFARREYEEAQDFAATHPEDNSSARGKLQLRIAFPEIEEIFLLSFSGTNVSVMDRNQISNPGIIQSWQRKIVAAYNGEMRKRARAGAGKGVQVVVPNTPNCFFSIRGLQASKLIPDEKKKDTMVPAFSKVGSGEKTSMITKPHWGDEPSGNADNALLTSLIVRSPADRSRYQALSSEGDTWRDAWSAESLIELRKKLGVGNSAAIAAGDDSEETPDTVSF